MTYRLSPNPIFWTIQGEGQLLGTPMCFVRLAGCSVGCVGCDTNYAPTHEMTLAEILAEIKRVVPSTWPVPWMWITGGEPTDQDVHPLIDMLVTLKYRVALATSGIRPLHIDTSKLLQWLSVSPHNSKFSQWHGHEVKLVPGLGNLTWENLPIIECGSFPWKYIQPLPGKVETDKAIEWVKQHPGWQLTIQAHKQWRIA